MSKSADALKEPPLIRWTGFCDECERQIQRDIRGRTKTEAETVWVRCAGCNEIRLLKDTEVIGDE